MIAEAYIEICTLLDAVEDILWKDLWAEQLALIDVGENGEMELPFDCPAAFIEVGLIPSTIGDNIQSVPASFTIYILDHCLADSYHGSGNQATSLAFLGLIEKVHKALQGKSGEHFGPLQRVAISRVPGTQGGYNAYSITYSSELTDYSGQPEYTQGPAPALNIEAGDPSPLPPQSQMFDLT